MNYDKTFKSVKTYSPEHIAKFHNVPLSKIRAELKKGIAVEMEHTKNKQAAMEIALDHLYEMPDYYTRLESIE